MSDNDNDDFDIFDEIEGEFKKDGPKYGKAAAPSPRRRISAERSSTPYAPPAPELSEPPGGYTLQNPRTAGWFRAAKDDAWDKIVGAKARGEHRNDNLNKEAANLMSGAVLNNLVTEGEIRDFLTQAANASGLDIDPNCGPHGIQATISSGFDAGKHKYGRRTNLPWSLTPNNEATNSTGEADPAPSNPRDSTRRVVLRSFHELEERRPNWVWSYGGKGRIQLGTVSIFGGPPGTGKSTAARWFVAQATNGELDGCWRGEEVNVAYVAVEEDLDAMVRPSLRAAGANLHRVFFPEITMNDAEKLLASQADELALTEQLLDNNIRMLVVDPIMATLGSGVDIHRNNEVREAIQPFVNMAQKMHGLVIGLAHYRKSGAASGVAALTGSSAFGEVARSVFGFMKGGMSPEEPRVMSQSKNSAGAEDLALQYALELTPITYPDGISAEMTRFKILGDSDVTVEDLMAEGGTQVTKVGDAKDWLHDYLMMHGPTDSKTVKKDGRADADFSDDTLYRAAKKLKVVFRNVSLEGKPRVTVWSLPEDRSGDIEPPRDWMDELDD